MPKQSEGKAYTIASVNVTSQIPNYSAMTHYKIFEAIQVIM